MYLENILPFAHHLLRGRLKNGDAALDGTAGNGHDTLLLAQCVGGGKVWAFDVQPQALQQTRRRLEEAGVSAELICDGHEKLADYVDRPLTAAVFNFGWLPGGDKTCTTQALYPGHEAGFAEAQAVEEWAAALPQQQFAVLKYVFTNRQNRPPYLLAIEKLRQK